MKVYYVCRVFDIALLTGAPHFSFLRNTKSTDGQLDFSFVLLRDFVRRAFFLFILFKITYKYKLHKYVAIDSTFAFSSYIFAIDKLA